MSALERALAQLRSGGAVVVVDDEDRENEGDLIVSAQLATPETIGLLVRHTSGLLCAPLEPERAARLGLPPMVDDNQDPKCTSYTISCDAARGISTGISAHDRALTANVLANPDSQVTDLIRPGHILPLIARPGGVLERAGHTEAAVDLMKLAGLEAVGVIGEVVHDDGSLMRFADLRAFAAEHCLPLLTIEELIKHRRSTEGEPPARLPEWLPEFEVGEPVRLPTAAGVFQATTYTIDGTDHVLLTAQGSEPAPIPLVRVHSECFTGDVLGSFRCDCGEQLAASLDAVHRDGGAVVYLRNHEGRGIGLANKLRAYALQDDGADTVEANRLLGLPVEARDYRDAARILESLGLTRIRMLTNNPEKVKGLVDHGIEVVEIVGVEVPARAENLRYLRTKRDRMNHVLPQLAKEA